MQPQIKAGQIWQEMSGDYRRAVIEQVGTYAVTIAYLDEPDLHAGYAISRFLETHQFIRPVQDLSPKMREELGKLVDQEWCEWFGPVYEDRWETLAESVKEGQRRIGVVLYLRGYADGKKEPENDPRS